MATYNELKQGLSARATQAQQELDDLLTAIEDSQQSEARQQKQVELLEAWGMFSGKITPLSKIEFAMWPEDTRQEFKVFCQQVFSKVVVRKEAGELGIEITWLV